MTSFEKLRDSDEGNIYFHDTIAGVVFMKVKGTYIRIQRETDPCGEKDEACIMKVRNTLDKTWSSVSNSSLGKTFVINH